jgi:hypothetical protein
MPLHGRPLSYREVLHRWSEAVVRAQNASRHLTVAQDACDDYGGFLRTVVGPEGYDALLRELLSAVEMHSTG